MSPRGEKGLALVLVMTVVMALAIIATPFVLSMILQERTGTSARYLSQADYGADGAKSYAMWRLMMSVDPLERRGGTAPFSSYTYDTLREFDVHLDDPALSGRLSIANPKGAIWGITVQDEQGKLNTRSCNVMALDTLLKLVDGRVVNLKDYLTLYSGRDATWAYPQRIRKQGFESGSTSGTGITVDNLAAIAPGSRVRASKPGMKSIETRIRQNAMLNPTRLGTNGPDGFTTEQSVAGFVDGVIEVELRHPVNINTARRETLIALFEGLHLWDERNGRVLAGSEVDRDSATQLATRFAGRDLQSLDQFLRALSGTSLSDAQKNAVKLNAVASNSTWLMDSGTAPLCFKSYDVYTLEASSSMNTPVGTEVAGRGYREVVSVSPPTTLHRWCESQYDFNQMIATVSQAMQQGGNPSKYSMSGFPYGNRLLTYPVALPGAPDISLGGNAYVTVQSAQDHRGENPDPNFNQLLAGAWDDGQHNRNHYPGEMDGKKAGGPEVFEWKNFFANNTTPEDEPPNVSQQRPDTGSGGFEMWAKVASDPGSATLFDIQELPTTNRVTLHVEGGDVILTVADSTIPYVPVGLSDPNAKYANGVAELHLLPTKKDFRFGQETWTHFAAYWKSNRYADLALLVDGFSDPDAKFGHFTTPGGQSLTTKLRNPLDLMSTSVQFDNSIVPQGELTPILVGGEVILIDTSGNVVNIRGARGTQPQAHPSQATVSMFGYSSKIRNGTVRATYPNGYAVTLDYGRIPQTNASPKYDFGLSPQVQVAGDKMNMGPPPFYEIDNSQATIGVLGNIMEFPTEGYIRIDNEIIYYTGRTNMPLGGTMPPSMGQFTGCLRAAQPGSVAATHRSLANITMWSVPATNLTNYPSPTIIQIGDEWFGPVQKDPTGKNFWVGFMEGANPHNFMRGYQCQWSIPQAHTTGEKILPTFLGRDVNGWPSLNLTSMGAGDRVTLVDASNQKATARIRRTSTDPRPMLNPPPNMPVSFQIQGNAASQIAGFYDHATRDWVPDDFHVRILKFPSGEMLSRTWLESPGANPPVNIGPLPGGQIDEIKAFAATKGRLRMAQQANAGDARMMITATNIARRQDGGLMKIGDEYVGFVQWQDNGTIGTLNPVKNGWLNSTQELHNLGDPVFYIPWVPVAALAADVAPDENVIRLKQRLAGDPQKYTSGYVLIDNEMLYFTWNDRPAGGNAGKVLSMPVKFDGNTGLYRGMFGTTAQNHSAQQSLAYGMPFRYYDTYKAREFDNSMLYFQWGVKMDLARWNTFKWTQEFQPATEPNIAVHALARVDNRGDFWDPPQMSDNVLLIESQTAGGNVNVKRTSYLQEAGQFDVRFYVEYKPGSFDATMPRTHESWKRIPKIKQVQVEYDRPSQTLHHEDR